MLSSVQRNRRNHKKRISRYFTVGSESWFSVLRIELYNRSKEAKACTNSPRTEALWWNLTKIHIDPFRRRQGCDVNKNQKPNFSLLSYKKKKTTFFLKKKTQAHCPVLWWHTQVQVSSHRNQDAPPCLPIFLFYPEVYLGPMLSAQHLQQGSDSCISTHWPRTRLRSGRNSCSASNSASLESSSFTKSVSASASQESIISLKKRIWYDYLGFSLRCTGLSIKAALYDGQWSTSKDSYITQADCSNLHIYLSNLSTLDDQNWFGL